MCKSWTWGLLFVVFVTLLKLCNMDVTFFWDSIDCLSHSAQLIYGSGMYYYAIDPLLDNGDPHVVPYYLALVWTLFGKTLTVTHCAFIPFVVGVVVQLVLLGRRLFGDEKGSVLFFVMGCTVVMCNTTLLSELLMLSVDVVVLFFGLMTVNAILRKSAWGMTIGFMGLIVSRRGMIIAATLMLVYAIGYVVENRRRLTVAGVVRMLLPTLPASMGVIFYLVMRLSLTGWFFTSDDNVWSGSAELVDFGRLVKNAVVYVWYQIDFGRVVVWGVLLYALFKVGIRQVVRGDLGLLITMFVALHVVFMAVVLPMTNSFGQRYFILHIVLLTFIACKVVMMLSKRQSAVVAMCVMIMGLLGGNAVVYPETVKINWTSTLKHLHFYTLREECFEYLKEQDIELSEVASGFSIYGNQDLIFVTERHEVIASEPSMARYYLYSNICNESDAFIEQLHRDWTSVRRFSRCGVFIDVMQRRGAE